MIWEKSHTFVARKQRKPNMAAHNELGAWGEELASAFLQQKGYTIIERDWKMGHKDLDIIAKHNGMVVFVEVKTRRNRVFGSPEVSVDYRKIKNLQAAANHYVKYRRIAYELRFDIVSVVGEVGTEPDIEHIENAF